MEWCKKYLLPLLSLLSLVLGVVLGIHIGNKNGSPDTSWIQSGASLSLIFITFQYVRVTQSSLKESRASRESSENSLEELRQARMDSLRPALSLRHLTKEKNTGPVQGKVKTTCLINGGLGFAMSIEVFSNLEWRSNNPESQLWYTSGLIPWPTQKISFGVPIGPDTGNENMQVEFISMKLHPYGYSPVEDPDVIFFIQYKDCFGRNFCTSQKACKQLVYGPLSEEDILGIKTRLEKVCNQGKGSHPVNVTI